MAFIRTKIHHNKRKPPRTYLFLVKNYRCANYETPRQATVRFLGRYKGETLEELKQRFPGLGNELEKWFRNRDERIRKGLQEAELSLRKSREYLDVEDSD